VKGRSCAMPVAIDQRYVASLVQPSGDGTPEALTGAVTKLVFTGVPASSLVRLYDKLRPSQPGQRQTATGYRKCGATVSMLLRRRCRGVCTARSKIERTRRQQQVWRAIEHFVINRVGTPSIRRTRRPPIHRSRAHGEASSVGRSNRGSFGCSRQRQTFHSPDPD
jgi:hypothetical protein